MDFLDEILGGLTGGFENTDDVPSIIDQFARILAQIIEAIRKFLAEIGFGGSDDDTTTTTA